MTDHTQRAEAIADNPEHPAWDEITDSMIPGLYAGATCYLDGRPAKVTGRLLKFASVGTMDGSARFEYSWQTVHRVMQNGGRFKS